MNRFEPVLQPVLIPGLISYWELVLITCSEPVLKTCFELVLISYFELVLKTCCETCFGPVLKPVWSACFFHFFSRFKRRGIIWDNVAAAAFKSTNAKAFFRSYLPTYLPTYLHIRSRFYTIRSKASISLSLTYWSLAVGFLK